MLLVLPALREGFWRDGPVYLIVHLSFLEVSTDRFLFDTYPAYPCDFVSIACLKVSGFVWHTLQDTDVHLLNLPRVATGSRKGEMVFGPLENPYQPAWRDLKILGQLALRDRLALIAFMDALRATRGSCIPCSMLNSESI